METFLNKINEIWNKNLYLKYSVNNNKIWILELDEHLNNNDKTFSSLWNSYYEKKINDNLKLNRKDEFNTIMQYIKKWNIYIDIDN